MATTRLRKQFQSFDWFGFALITTLSFIGLAFVYSTTYHAQIPFSIFFKKQCFGVISGLGIYCTLSFFDARNLMRVGFFAYFGVICLLIFTILKGSVGMGGQRWIDLVFFRMQPSELAKLFFPAYATYYVYTHQTHAFTNRIFIFLLGMLSISCLLIRKQPDLGTSIIVLLSGLATLWIIGLPTRYFWYGLIVCAISAPITWHLLKDYQKQRIFVFLGYGNTNKERYQIEQSKIAVGSGGLRGKGFMCGTQNRLQFLPESRTDFIFSVVAEESGFVGACMLILLYIMLFFHLLHRAAGSSSLFFYALSIGLITHIVLSALINMGMVIGLLPVVGIPLPLISYGVSNLWVTYASLGWLASIAAQRSYTRV